MIALAMLGLLIALAVSAYEPRREGMRVKQAVLDIQALQFKIEQAKLEFGSLPLSLELLADGLLDPWGNPYQSLSFADNTGNREVRKDKNLGPINSEYDLNSLGADGMTQSPLTAKVSCDDVIRANSGAFIGLAKDY